MAQYDLTQEKDVKKISRRVRYAFKKLSKGIGDADECAQEILLGMLEGKHRHQTVDQAVIDYLRTISGRKGMVRYSQRQNFARADSLGPGDLEKLLQLDNGGYRHNRLDFDECARWLGDKIDRGCFGLFFRWGLNVAEIGNLFGFSESRVSQRLERVQKRVSARIKAEKRAGVPGEGAGQMAIVLRPETERKLWGVGEITFERMETGESFGVESFNETSF